MSDQSLSSQPMNVNNVITFPLTNLQILDSESKPAAVTPIYDALIAESNKLDALSKYRCTFDYGVYKQLEIRFKDKPVRGGIVCKTDLKLVNFHPSCSKCHYTLELDTYGRGCVHECAYCYAKDELSLHGYWNNPIPFPINLNEIRKIFYTVFETDKHSKWREILEKRIPIRIGSMSDSFMWSDLKYKITYEVLRLLKHYDYPHIIFTRSDLAAHDLYLGVYDPDLTAIQFSICGTNDAITKIMEPGAPNVKRRIAALKKLGESGIHTAVRINPLFPTFPDGYFTDHESVVARFGSEQSIPRLDFFDIDHADEFLGSLSEARVKTVLAGFVRLKSSSLNVIKKQTGIDMYPFFRPEVVNTGLRGNREKKYSDKEIAYYYRDLSRKTKAQGMNFSTCYIGNGGKDYYQYQHLWDNKQDCCDVIGKVASFKTSAQKVSWSLRAKFSQNKKLVTDSKAEEKALDAKFREVPAIAPSDIIL